MIGLIVPTNLPKIEILSEIHMAQWLIGFILQINQFLAIKFATLSMRAEYQDESCEFVEWLTKRDFRRTSKAIVHRRFGLKRKR